MKNLINIGKWLINNYKSNNDNYVPIYSGDELLSFGKVAR